VGGSYGDIDVVYAAFEIGTTERPSQQVGDLVRNKLIPRCPNLEPLNLFPSYNRVVLKSKGSQVRTQWTV
jgi:microcompartment protein CcmL/EutN